MTYPATNADSRPVFESIRPALIGAGFIDEQTGTFTGDPRELTAALIMGLRQLESADPWGEPFALMVRSGWRSINGTDPGDVQMRVTDNGVQLRERTPSTTTCMTVGHFIQTCDDCWTVSALQPSSQWHPATDRIQVRIGDAGDNATRVRRIEVRRRMSLEMVQPEAVWTEPWQLPRYHETEFYKTHRDNPTIDTTWVDATPEGDIQVSEGHTFPRGILVRQATGCKDNPWTMPTFLPETRWCWSNLIPDGSVQFRCWKKLEEEFSSGGYRIEVRQHVGRKPVLAVDPVWGAHKSSYGGRTCTTNGYTLELLRETPRYGSGFRSVLGLRVTDPSGMTRDILVTDHDVTAGPDLLVKASSQGYFSWRNGTPEPQAATTMWSMPEQYTLQTEAWTMLSDMVRARISRGHPGVRIEVLQDQPVWRRWGLGWSLWAPDGTKPFGTIHDLTDTLRVTFRPDHVAEVQRTASAGHGLD